MAKIILVDSPISLKERYGKFSMAGGVLPPYGLLTLAAVLRKKGHKVNIIENSISEANYGAIVSKLSKDAPEYIGISATTLSINSANILTQAIKKALPRAVVIIGGCHISAIPEETMAEFPDFDIGVIGEGEETLPELIACLEAKGDLVGVNGIVYRSPGKIKLNQPRKLISDMDSLPFPAWDLLPSFPQKYRPAIHKVKKTPATYILTSRGCPSQCVFCDRSTFGHTYRFFSQEYLLEMVNLLYSKFGVKEISFEDDTFLINKNRVAFFCEKILESHTRISWTCNGRVDSVEPGILRLMKKAGCWQIGFGIESGDQKILNGARKNITLEKVRQAVDLARNAGIDAKGFFILGFPNETEDTLLATLNFAKSIRLTDITVSFMTPFPGSELYNIADKYGAFNRDWRRMNILNTVFIPSGLSEERLKFYHKKMLKEFYFRLPVMFGYLKRVFSNGYLFKNFLGNFFAALTLIATSKKYDSEKN